MSHALYWHEQVPIPSRPKLTVWSSLMREEAAELRRLADHRRVLEIGTAFGYSTLVMASVAEHVWTVDPHNTAAGQGNYNIWGDPGKYATGTLPVLKENLRRARLAGKVTVCQGYSQRMLDPEAPFRAKLVGRIDMAFIDGDHSLAACLADLNNCAGIMGPGGVICVHDYDETSNPNVRQAVDTWRDNRPIEVVGTLAVIELR